MVFDDLHIAHAKDLVGRYENRHGGIHASDPRQPARMVIVVVADDHHIQLSYIQVNHIRINKTK